MVWGTREASADRGSPQVQRTRRTGPSSHAERDEGADAVLISISEPLFYPVFLSHLPFDTSLHLNNRFFNTLSSRFCSLIPIMSLKNGERVPPALDHIVVAAMSRRGAAGYFIVWLADG